MELFEHLCTEYQLWCDNHGFPQLSADELILEVELTDEQKYWLNLVNIRVDALPFDFIERTYTIESMGEEHASEYINNEFKVPKDKRKEVALSRVEGLSSIRDYIKSKGSKKQKFHYESSLKGALLYASSLGINIDKY